MLRFFDQGIGGIDQERTEEEEDPSEFANNH